MTNELLAALIGQGGNDELLPLLWEKMRRYYRMASTKYVAGHVDRCARCGITQDDILQESYFAMLDGIKAYNARPPEQSAMLFISFCGFPFRNHAAALIGMRTRSSHDEPLNNAAFSLDEPMQTEDGEISRADIIPDEAAEEPFREIEQADFRRDLKETVQEALVSCPRELEVIERVYYRGDTLKATGTAIGVSVERVRQIRRDALNRLRINRRLRELCGLNPYRHVGYAQFRRSGSIVEQTAEAIERIYARRYNKRT